MYRSVSFLLSIAVALGLAVVPVFAVAIPAHAHYRAHATKLPVKSSSRGRKAIASASRHSRSTRASSPKAYRSRGTTPAYSKRSRRMRTSYRRESRNQIMAPVHVENVRLMIPPPMRGSYESLVRQNQMAQVDGLERILDDQDLQDRIDHGSLVPVPVSASLRVNTDLPENRRYCRPWTAQFLKDLSKAHAARFGSSIEVTSAVRTVEYQRRLRMVNGNAAAADGDVASPHLTGGTIDIAKQGMSSKEIGWLRSWLIPLEQAGLIDVEEEFKQACFHISVYKSYADHGSAKPGVLSSPSMLALRAR